MAKPSTARRHNSSMYRSGLEVEAAAYLKDRQKIVSYEKLKIEWEDLKYRTYTPEHLIFVLYLVTLIQSFTRELRVGTATGVIRRVSSGRTALYLRYGLKRKAVV